MIILYKVLLCFQVEMAFWKMGEAACHIVTAIKLHLSLLYTVYLYPGVYIHICKVFRSSFTQG